jgi:hypothetical protein
MHQIPRSSANIRLGKAPLTTAFHVEGYDRDKICDTRTDPTLNLTNNSENIRNEKEYTSFFKLQSNSVTHLCGYVNVKQHALPSNPFP